MPDDLRADTGRALRSMTGYATRSGAGEGRVWAWELRSVNGRGLDLRMRLPDGLEGLEAAVRSAVQAAAARGNVTASLRLQRDETEAGAQVSEAGLDRALSVLARIEERAQAQGMALRPASAADVAAMRGVIDTATTQDDPDALREALLGDLPPLIADWDAARRDEGAALAAVLAARLDEIADLAAEARNALAPRAQRQSDALREALDRLGTAAPEVDSGRLAQELALLAVKSDIAEELDRLDAHVAAARALLEAPGPKGRKLDFLTQEFNREANTLCAKATSSDLTRIGLALKHAVDQMREQVQNVE